MHIAVNAMYRLHGGGDVHLHRLFVSWTRTGVDREHTFSLITRSENVALLRPSLSENIKVYPIGGRFFNLPARLAWEQLVLPSMLKRLRPDVLLNPANIAPFIKCSVPSVVALRNAAPFCSNVTPALVGTLGWLRWKSLGALMRASSRAARRVIFVSQYFKRLFIKRFGYPAERGDVIYHGRDGLNLKALDRAQLQQLGIRAPYLLSVSHLQPYKNIPALIEGYGLARQRLQARGLQLVLVGKPAGAAHLQKLKDLIHKLRLEDWVLLAGGVPHEAIGPLLQGCHSFVFQSTCENCPQTLIEALAAGVATACSRAGVMPEIAGDAAVYFDPFAPREIAETLTRMSEDDLLRTQLRERARQQALVFPTWDEVGTLTVRSLERAVQGSREAARLEFKL